MTKQLLEARLVILVAATVVVAMVVMAVVGVVAVAPSVVEVQRVRLGEHRHRDSS